MNKIQTTSIRYFTVYILTIEFNNCYQIIRYFIETKNKYMHRNKEVEYL